MASPSLNISVLEHAQQSRHSIFGVSPFECQEPNFTLNKHELPQPVELVSWSAYHEENRGVTDLQSALDSFVFACFGRRDLPQVRSMTRGRNFGLY